MRLDNKIHILNMFVVFWLIITLLFGFIMFAQIVNIYTGNERSIETSCYDRYKNEIVEGVKCRATIHCGGMFGYLVEDKRCNK